MERHDYLPGLNFKTVVVLPNLEPREKDEIAAYVHICWGVLFRGLPQACGVTSGKSHFLLAHSENYRK